MIFTFPDFSFKDQSMNEQLYEAYKSKYLDLYDKVKTDHYKEKVSILEDVDFELVNSDLNKMKYPHLIELVANFNF